PSPPFLLVLIPSAPSHSTQRQAIRDTWAGVTHRHPTTLTTRTLFVLGLPRRREEQEALWLEFHRHQDLL
ncbi:B3GT4 galactosyltransferase, partial [Chordeiles acutipennis]|nr:B3GT4 galactosyltransferase [Chordeiles acutipennis]